MPSRSSHSISHEKIARAPTSEAAITANLADSCGAADFGSSDGVEASTLPVFPAASVESGAGVDSSAVSVVPSSKLPPTTGLMTIVEDVVGAVIVEEEDEPVVEGGLEDVAVVEEVEVEVGEEVAASAPVRLMKPMKIHAMTE